MMSQCPFCYCFLKKFIEQFHVSFYCDNEDCMMSREMPRFIVRYEVDFPLFDGYLISQDFCIDEFYVKIDFKKNSTIIYKFEVVIIEDPLEFNKVISFDFKDVSSIREKIKLITTFS